MLGYTLWRCMPPSLLKYGSRWWLIGPRRLLSTPSRKGVDRRIQSIIRDTTSSIDEQVSKALENNLFALAAKLWLDSSSAEPDKIPSQQTLFRITSGLALFDPALTPLNLRTLELLFKQYPDTILSSFEKSTLLNALLSWSHAEGSNGDIGLVREGFRLATSISPDDPVPVTVLISLVEYAEKRGQLAFLAQLWAYTRAQYPHMVLSYYPILVRVMRLFSRTERYRPIAKEVAYLLVSDKHQDYDPSVLVSIARVALKLKDVDLASQLQSRIFALESQSRPALGALLALYTRVGDTEKTRTVLAQLHNCGSRKALSTEEWSSLVKVVTETYGVKQAETFASKNNRGNRRALADVSICHQAIHDGNRELYKEKLASLEAGGEIHKGVLLNLMLEWELRNGGKFVEAKRHYLNWSHTTKIDIKQRQIALRTLLNIAGDDESAYEWAISEARRNNLPTSALAPTRGHKKQG